MEEKVLLGVCAEPKIYDKEHFIHRNGAVIEEEWSKIRMASTFSTKTLGCDFCCAP